MPPLSSLTVHKDLLRRPVSTSTHNTLGKSKIKTFDMSVSAAKTVTTKLNDVGSKTVPSGAVVSSLGIDNFALWSLYSLTVNHVLLELDQEGNLKPRKDSTFLNSIL